MSKAFLLTWNPKYYTPDGELAQIQEYGNCFSCWSTNCRQMEHGDHLFLMRQGKEPRGIVAGGVARPDIQTEKLYLYHNGTDYISLLWQWFRPEDPVYTLSDLQTLWPKQHWSPRGSGIRIQPPIDRELATLVEKFRELQTA